MRYAAFLAGYGLLALLLLAFPTHCVDLDHDHSSHATFEYYAARHFQFGTQVYQNIGPYGYVQYVSTYSGYLHLQKTVLANACRLILLLLIIWASRQLPRPGLRIWWWASFFLAVALGSLIPEDLEQPLSYLAIYLAALYLLQNRRDWLFHLSCGGLLFFLAFLALTKHTSLVLVALVIGAVCLNELVRWRAAAQGNPIEPQAVAVKPLRSALVPAGFLVCLLFHWLVAGQHLGNLPLFIRGVFAFSAGYNEALMLRERSGFALASALLTALFLFRSVADGFRRRRPLARVLLEVALLYLVWKHGHVRGDGEHVRGFLVTLFLAMTPWFNITPDPGTSAARFSWPRGARLLERLAFGAAILLAAGLFWTGISRRGGGVHAAPVWECLAHNLEWVLSPGRQRAALEAQLREVRAVAALPEIKSRVKNATIDLFGYLPGFILLNEMNYWPRPMPISFAACNKFLQQANESFYRAPRTAPQYVLCQLGTIDTRTVCQDDALALHALTDNYHPVLGEKGLLLLERNPAPLVAHAEWTHIGDYTVPFGKELSIANPNHDLIWMEAHIEHSLLGKLFSFCYRPPPCLLVRWFVGETNAAASLYTTAMGDAGCLINPSIENNHQLATLFLPYTDLQGFRRVESLAFSSPGYEKYFAPEIRLRCYCVPRPPSSVDKVK